MDRTFDVCIIGSGASGAVVASYLVECGLDVLMLEQGPRVEENVDYDELSRDSECALAREEDGEWSKRGYPWSTSNLGGGTVFYGAASFRYREIDFDPSECIQVPDLDVRWPYTYNELEPYYDAVEIVLGVARSRGIDPTEPPVRIDVLPSHPLSAFGSLLWEAADKLGLHPFPTPLAINSKPYRGGQACEQSTPCIAHLCPTGAKADAVTVFLDPLHNSLNFTLRTSMKAVRLTQNRPGVVDGVVCLDLEEKHEVTFRARIFMLACNAVQTAALLLRSMTKYSPMGIGNEYDMVGRSLCFKVSEYVTARVKGFPLDDSWDELYLGPFSTVSICDYYVDADCPTGLGGLIYESKPPFVPRRDRKGALIRVECMISDHPSSSNRVYLARETDQCGLPILVLDYKTHPQDRERLDYMIHRCEELLGACGGTDIHREASNYALGSGHLHGTCRAGDDPRNSVVDKQSRVHSVDNLYIADGSFMPYPGSLNPTLTIQAHALKVATHISDQSI